MNPVRTLLAMLVLGMLSACEPERPTDPALTQRLLHFTVDGEPASPALNPTTGEFYMQFSGALKASRIDPETGEITGEHVQRLGHFGPAVVAFRINPSKRPDEDGFLTFRCIRCIIQVDAGSDVGALLKPLKPDNEPDFPDPIASDEPTRTLALDVPFNGRFLQHFGPVSPRAPFVLGVAFRGAGCGGSQEVSGRGQLAGHRGTLCMNGQFDFAGGDPNALANLLAAFNGLASLADANALAGWFIRTTLHGESDCPLALQAGASS